jgi:hypothetical protein
MVKKKPKPGEMIVLEPGVAFSRPIPDAPYIAEQLRPLAVPLEELVPDPKNARKHNDSNLKAIVASLKAFGQVKPIVVNRETKIIEAGNGAFMAAQKLGWSHIAAVYVDHDAAAARGYALADNRTAELAEWDENVLFELLDEVQNDSPDLFDDLMLEAFHLEEEAEKQKPKPKIMLYQVLVDCENAEKQAKLQEDLLKKGLKCRILTI